MRLTFRRRVERSGRVAVVAALVTAFVIGNATPALAEIIISDGPLIRIQTTEFLNCDVGYDGDDDPEFYPPEEAGFPPEQLGTACGTFLALGDTVYGPQNVPQGAVLQVPFETVDQILTGSGTVEDPFQIRTEVQATADVSIVQIDSYIVGQNAYRTDIEVVNDSADTVDAVLYHAGDCYLQNEDRGFGEHDDQTGAITCRGGDGGDPVEPGDRIEQFIPISPDENYLHDNYLAMWEAIATGNDLPDECQRCRVFQDNGMALSWHLTVPAGGSETRSMLTNFSPLGFEALPTALTPDPPSVPAGREVEITFEVENPNDVRSSLRALHFTIPEGASYVPGSTSGGLTEDPVVEGVNLTWAGPLRVLGGQSSSFSFRIVAPVTPGSARVDFVGADAGEAPVLPSFVEIPIEAHADLSVELVTDPVTVDAGEQVTWRADVDNIGPNTAENATFDLPLPDGLAVEADDIVGDGWSCGVTGGNDVSCTIATFGAGSEATIEVPSTVGPSQPAGQLTATATVASDTPDLGPEGNNDDDATVSVERSADVVITQFLGPEEAFVGDPVRFTATVRNDGPSSATGVELTLTPPSGALPPHPCSEIQPGGTCSHVFRFEFDVDDDDAEVELEVTGAEFATITDSRFVDVDPSADLTIELARPDEPIHAGDQVTWSATLANDGPSSAADATYDLALDPALVDMEITQQPEGWSCSIDADGVVCTTGGVESGPIGPIELVGTLPSDTEAGNLTATAEISSSTHDPVDDNIEIVEVATDRLADLFEATLIGPPDALVEEPVTFTASVTNGGPSTATNVRMTLSTGQTFVFPVIAPNETATHDFEGVSFDTDGLQEVELTIEAIEPDPDGEYPSATADIMILAAADLSVVLDPPDVPMVAGAPAEWSVVVANPVGPSDATDLHLTLDLRRELGLPVELSEIVAPGWECVVTDDVLECDSALLAEGATSTITFTALAPADAATGIVEGEAHITSGVVETEPEDNTSIDDVTLERHADVSVAITGPEAVLVGEAYVVTATVTNLGPSTATATVAEFSSGATFDLGTLVVGESVEEQVEVTFGAAGEAVVSVDGLASETDLDTSNNSATLPTDIQPLDITLTPGGTATDTGTDFVPIARVLVAGQPVAGAQVEFVATKAGEADVVLTATSGADGVASVPYTRQSSGLDQVEATATLRGVSSSATILHTWEAADLQVSLSPAGQRSDVGVQFRVTVTALTRDGDPAVGADVVFTVSGSGQSDLSGPATTDANGQAEYAYTRAEAGTDSIQAEVTAGESEGAAAIDHVWVGLLPPPEQCLQLEQPAVNPGGQTVVATGIGPPDTEVTITLDGEPLATTTTDADGRYEVILDIPPLDIGRHEIGATCGAAIVTAGPLDVVSRGSTTGTAAAAVTTTATVLTFFVLLLGPLTRLGSTTVVSPGS